MGAALLAAPRVRVVVFRRAGRPLLLATALPAEDLRFRVAEGFRGGDRFIDRLPLPGRPALPGGRTASARNTASDMRRTRRDRGAAQNSRSQKGRAHYESTRRARQRTSTPTVSRPAAGDRSATILATVHTVKPDAPPAAGLPDRTQLSHYRLVERIGAGGMGIVYRAVDAGLDRPVALKVIGHVSDPDRRLRFV